MPRTETTESEAGPVARVVHPAAIRWMHWINFPVLFVMIWSGLRIYWADDVRAVGIGSWEWFHLFPDGFYEALGLDRALARGIAFHFTFGWLFVLNGAAYLAYLAISGQWRHIVPDRPAWREAGQHLLHDLHLRADAPPQGRYNAAQRVAYTAVLAIAVLIVATGFAIYKPTQLAWLTAIFGGYDTARLLHFWSTIALFGFFLVHVVQVARAGWRQFVPMITGVERIDVSEATPATDDDRPSPEQPSPDRPSPDREEVPA